LGITVNKTACDKHLPEIKKIHLNFKGKNEGSDKYITIRATDPSPQSGNSK